MDLHDHLGGALQARLEVARAAEDEWRGTGPWPRPRIVAVAEESGSGTVAYLRGTDPATEIRRVEALLRVVERHQPYPHPSRAGVVQCDHCAAQCHSRSGLACDSPADAIFPCVDIRDLAAGEGIEVET